MATFLNKKQQVYDLQLTPYGNYLLSIGSFRPVYYAFFDDNIIYDTRYAADSTNQYASSTYTQISDDSSTSAMGGKTLILTDMEKLSHTITFRGATNQSATTAYVAGIKDQNNSAPGILKSLKLALALAIDAGLINLTTGPIDTSGANPTMVISMATRGVNTDTPLGTAPDDTLATMPAFSAGGGTAYPYYDGDAVEGQNNVNKRIKEETAYLESQVLFRDVESTLASLEEGTSDEIISYFDLTPTQKTPAADIFKFESAIGDAALDGPPRSVPAWKLLMLQGRISSSIYRSGPKQTPSEQVAREGILLNSQIPQINLTASYSLKVSEDVVDVNPASVRSYGNTTKAFADKKVIKLEMDDPIIYLEETNTQLWTENFDIEVFEVESGSLSGYYNPTLHRRYFERTIPQIENGFMLTETQLTNEVQTLTTSSVEYHFDILIDKTINQTLACQGLETFNKQSYYVDFDFECAEDPAASTTAVFYDIYGSVTEPEICE